MNNYFCEVCNNNEFYKFDYFTNTSHLRKKIIVNAFRRPIVNLGKLFMRSLFYFLPKIYLSSLRKRAYDPYKRIQSIREILLTLKKLNQAEFFFKDRKILICKKCDLGAIYPKISEEDLVDYYKNDYWIENLGELEPAESNRTRITYKLLEGAIGLKTIKTIVEFGSASAHLSRYFKSKEPQILFDIIDPGIIWKDILKKEINEIYSNIDKVNKKYDLLLSSHSLEHVSNINYYFEKFKNLLNINGYLYFEIPNCEEKDTIFSDAFGSHLPHTYFFTQKSFENIAKKYGFNIVFNKTFSRSYSERFSKTKLNISSMDENPKGTYLRVLLKKI